MVCSGHGIELTTLCTIALNALTADRIHKKPGHHYTEKKSRAYIFENMHLFFNVYFTGSGHCLSDLPLELSLDRC